MDDHHQHHHCGTNETNKSHNKILQSILICVVVTFALQQQSEEEEEEEGPAPQQRKQMRFFFFFFFFVFVLLPIGINVRIPDTTTTAERTIGSTHALPASRNLSLDIARCYFAGSPTPPPPSLFTLNPRKLGENKIK
jgi:Ca2+/Na+ antiporter